MGGLASSVIAAVKSQVGLGEYPNGSNRNFISQWYGLIGPWCAMTISWGAAHGGFSPDGGNTLVVPGMRQTTAKGWAYVPYLHSSFADAGRLVAGPAPGDVFMLRDLSHTGYVDTVDWGSKTFSTVEGNYQNRLAMVRRTFSSCYFGRFPYSTPTPPPPQEDDLTGPQAQQLADVHRFLFTPQTQDGKNGHDLLIDTYANANNVVRDVADIKRKLGA